MRVASIILSSAVVCFFFSTVQAGAPSYLLEWSDPNPIGVAVTPSDKVFVSEQSADRVSKFALDGTAILQWGTLGTGPGAFDEPWGLATDSFGNIYVADFQNERVQKFDSSGNYILEWDGPLPFEDFSSPRSIAINANDEVYVTDFSDARVRKFDKDGNFLLAWGSPGTGNGQFDIPEGIAVDASLDVYVADRGNHRVQKFDKDGNFILEWGALGSADGEFNQPIGICVTPSGTIYVADLNDKIQEFDNTGNFILSFGSPGGGDGEFNFSIPIGGGRMAFDSQGDLYVADTGNDRIQKFTFSAQNASVLSGIKFNDLNGNGVQDGGEAGLEGWTIYLKDDSGTVVDSTTTDSSGNYTFTGVAAGTHIICEAAQPGWVQTSPPYVYYKFEVGDGDTLSGYDFGNHEYCSEPVTVFEWVGVDDDFDTGNGPEPLSASDSLAAQQCSDPKTECDVCLGNHCVLQSFTKYLPNSSCLTVGATLTLRVKSCGGSSGNDNLNFWHTDGTRVWSMRIQELRHKLNGEPMSWSSGDVSLFELDLADLPEDANGVTNILASLQDGILDLKLGDDTGVDFFTLEAEVCCSNLVAVLEETLKPFHLHARPNPVANSTEIFFELQRPQKVSVELLDINGRRIAVLLDEQLSSGLHHIPWNGTDASGAPVASGVYFIQLNTASGTATGKITLLQ